MPDTRVTIDGKEVAVPRNSTILQAAEAAGIKIPTLCAHSSLKPIGACRMCLVEVEKQRVLQPACTFPVSEGMVVHTHSPQVVEARKFVLQLLFSERNHFCMYCQTSGSCDLQNLAYEYGLDHWEFDRAFPKLSVDASRKYFVMDHNRCILCRRCIRACDELVGNNTLGLMNRGSKTIVIADANVPFGQSGCVSCGTCLQNCPTGALMDRASAYMGADSEIQRVKSRCMACSIGCGVELIVRENRVIRIEGDWDAEPNHGLLCEIGRFIPLNEKRQRVRQPLVRGEKGWQETSWEEALSKAAAKLKGSKLCSVVLGFASSEAAVEVQALPGQKVLWGAVAGDSSKMPLSALDEADLFVVVNTDLTKDYQVAGFAIKRGVGHRGARLIILDDESNGLEPWSHSKWSPKEAQKALEIAQGAQTPVIVCDARHIGLAQTLAQDLPKAKLIAFASGGNARGIVSRGMAAVSTLPAASSYFVVAGEAGQMDGALREALQKADSVVVQASFRQPWDEVADIILPTPITSEKSGTMTNVEGRTSQVVVGVTTKLLPETEVITRIGALMK